MNLVILGLSITSSWGNGHATTYRGLVRELTRRGHRVLFLERDRPWYSSNRDLPKPPYGRTELYSSLEELQERYEQDVKNADAVIVGSFVPQGIAVGRWVQATTRGIPVFYDIDTPVTLARLERGEEEYLRADLIPKYALYLSFTGGPILNRLERDFGSPMARALYCSVDKDEYFPEERETRWDLGYLGTYSDDRQPTLERLLVEPAREWAEGRFVVAGAQYPDSLKWAPNVERIPHLPPPRHRGFYNSMRFTLNVTRKDMIEAGYSPSVRLFEAAACGTPIISDRWKGLETIFELDSEIIVAETAQDIRRCLREMPESERRAIGRRARERVLSAHTSAHRALELESYVLEATQRKSMSRKTQCKAEAKIPSVSR